MIHKKRGQPPRFSILYCRPRLSHANSLGNDAEKTPAGYYALTRKYIAIGGMFLKKFFKRKMKPTNFLKLGKNGKLGFALYAALAVVLCCPLAVFATSDPSGRDQQPFHLYLFPDPRHRPDPAGLGRGAGWPLLPEPRPQPAVSGLSHLGGRACRNLCQGDPRPHHRRRDAMSWVVDNLNSALGDMER